MLDYLYVFYKKLKYKLTFGKRRKKYKKEFQSARLNFQNKKYNNKLILIKEDGQSILNPQIEGLEVIFYGENSTVEIHEPCQYFNCKFRVGSNNQIKILKNIFIHNFELPYQMREGSKLFIAENLSCVGCKIFMHDEPNTIVTIGKDCMISFDVIIWPSDGHAIIGKGNLPLNPKEDIYIGNHVWLGMGTTVLKGSQIPDNSVLAAKSVFTRKSNIVSSDKGKIFAGIPAKLVKSGEFTWKRENCFDYQKNDQKNK